MRLSRMGEIIVNKLREDTKVSEYCLNSYTGDFDELVLDKHQYDFIDFVDEDRLSDEQANIMRAFMFETVPTANYHHWYHNQMMLKIHQLNYGIELYDIMDEESLIASLSSRVELELDDEYKREEMLELFIEAIGNFFIAVDEVQRCIENGEDVDEKYNNYAIYSK